MPEPPPSEATLAKQTKSVLTWSHITNVESLKKRYGEAWMQLLKLKLDDETLKKVFQRFYLGI